MTPDAPQELDLRQFVRAVRRRIWLIVALAIVLAALVFVWSATKPDLYRASSEVRVIGDVSAEVVGGQAKTEVDRELANAIHAVESSTVGLGVADVLGRDRQLVESVTATAVEDTDIIEIDVVSRNPQVAKAAADAFANVFVEQRRADISDALSEQAAEFESLATDLEAQLAEIDALRALEPDATSEDLLLAQRSDLLKQITDLKARASDSALNARIRSEGIAVVQEALPPSAPFSPTPARDAVLAGVLGILLGMGLAILLEWLDNRVRSTSDAERIVGVPALGVVPFEGRRSSFRRHQAFAKKQPMLVGTSSTSTEAYRTLQTSLRFSSLGKQKRRIAITSSSGGEGKTTVCANLAKVLAESGLRVVVISGDLRRPMIGQLLGVEESSRGLSSVLLGDASLSECLVRVDLDNGRSLALLPAGPLIQNPAALLSSPQFGELLERIEAAGVDFILVDCAPVLPVSDTLAITDHVDGVLVMAVAGRTKRNNLAETAERLRQVGADIIGVVLNGVVPGKGYYGYGYGYGYTADESYGTVAADQDQAGDSGSPPSAA